MSGLAVFRANAGATIGGGHVTRCLALARALEAGGWSCAFAAGGDTHAAVSAVRLCGYEALALESAGNETEALARRWPGGCDLLVVDHYGLDAGFERACRPWAKRLMVIDDLADRPHDCDLLLDATPGRLGDEYAGIVPRNCRLLLGPAYALLRPEFAAARDASLARRRKLGPVRRILVSLGAADTSDLIGTVLLELARSTLAAEITVVLGQAVDRERVLKSYGEPLPQTVKIYQAVQNMAKMMANADLAIGAAGSSSFERCCLGVPSIVIVTAPNQRLLAERMAAEGAALVLGWHADIGAQGIAAAFDRLAENAPLRARMAESGAAMCDGLGAQRSAHAIAALAERLPA